MSVPEDINNLELAEKRENVYLLQFDGCSKGNPGKSGSGAVLFENGVEIWHGTHYCGASMTNNQAEYIGLIIGLQYCIENNIKNILVEGDSLLVIRQMNGIYKCSSLSVLSLYEKAVSWKRKFNHIEFKHIERKYNKRADALANDALTTLTQIMI
jgi:ribonuclease HI